MNGTESNLRFDHAIILVKNLKRAIRNYQKLGFHVVQGGELKGGGIVDYALHTERLEQQLDLIRERGLVIAGPIEGYRNQTNGTKLAFQWGLSHDQLPFLITDITPRNLRVPIQETGKHTNGSVGMKELVMAVKDLKEANKHYSALLGLEGNEIGPCRYKYSLGPTDLILVSADESNDVNNHLDKYGDSPFAVGLRTHEKSRLGEMDRSRTREARIHLML